MQYIVFNFNCRDLPDGDDGHGDGRGTCVVAPLWPNQGNIDKADEERTAALAQPTAEARSLIDTTQRHWLDILGKEIDGCVEIVAPVLVRRDCTLSPMIGNVMIPTGIQESSASPSDDCQVQCLDCMLPCHPVQHRSPDQVGGAGTRLERVAVCGSVYLHCDGGDDQRFFGCAEETH